ELELVVELEVRIAAVESIVIARYRRITVGDERSQPRVPQKIPFQTTDKKIIRRCRIEPLCFHAQETDVVTLHLTGDSRSANDRNGCAVSAQSNTPAEKRHEVAVGRSESKDAGVFEKEVSFLGKELIESSQVHLLLVDFNLRKVGSIRPVERERWCE